MGKIYATRFYCIISSRYICFNGCDPRDSGAQATQSAWQKTQAADMTKSQKNTNNDADFI